MRLMIAHRILIGTAIAFFLFYAVWELAGVSSGRGSAIRAVISVGGAVALGLYFRTLWKKSA